MKFNKQQKEVIDLVEGPIRVIAGPGSGKTTTLVGKVEFLLNNGYCDENEVLLITFTNKAVREIKKRVKLKFPYFSNVFTYHGWCYQFLIRESDGSGFGTEWRVLDSHDQKRMLKKLLKENPISGDEIEDKFLKKVLALHNLRCSLKNLPERGTEGFSEAVFKFLDIYSKEKNRRKYIDFDDILYETYRVLRDNSRLRAKYMKQYRYLMVDEFQDTNKIQFEILKLISNQDSNLTVVGDPDQNIYSWRGAEIKLINNFEKWYPTQKTVFLEKNYRSTPEIIELGKNLIKNNEERLSSFVMNPSRKDGGVVDTQFYVDSKVETQRVAENIKKKIEEDEDPEEIAVIVRISSHTREIESVFTSMGIPYKVVGAFKFYERKEVKEICRFLEFFADQSDETLGEIINIPAKGVGPTSFERLLEFKNNGQTLWNTLIEHKEELSPKLKVWVSTTEKFLTEFYNKNIKKEEIIVLLENYFLEIGYLSQKIFFKEEDKKENVLEMIQLTVDSISLMKGELGIDSSENLRLRLNSFLSSVALASAGDETPDDGLVSILTAHASKGTEYTTVFIPSFYEGHWPSNLAIKEGNIEEERRVAFVAVTRAKNNLYLSSVDTSTGYGDKHPEWSRFIKEMDVKNFQVPDKKEFKCPKCGVGNMLKRGNNFYGCSRFPDCKNTMDDDAFELLIIKDKQKKHVLSSKSKGNKNNTIVDNNKIGAIVVHTHFGEGKIIENDGSFIKVDFNGSTEELLIGHMSYELK